MFTSFDKQIDSKQLYFNLSSSFQIVSPQSVSKTFKLAGLYAIYKDDVCYYVGQSQNIASRLSQHLLGKYSGCTRIDVYGASNYRNGHFYNLSKSDRKSFLEHNEMILMQLCKPIENLITPPSDFNHDEDIKLETLSHDDWASDVSCCIHVGKWNISVTECLEVDIMGLTCAKTSVDTLVTIAENHGAKKAMEVFCNG